jgi:ABC-2 type transport system ATP-binding protein
MAAIAIQTQNLTRSFGLQRAIDDLTLQAPMGLIFGLWGPSGAGKTTLIQILWGDLSPTSGSAQVLGWDVQTGRSGTYDRLSDNYQLDGS